MPSRTQNSVSKHSYATTSAEDGAEERFAREFHASFRRNLFLKLCDENSEVCFLGIAFRRIRRPDDFQSCRVDFKTEVCVSTSTLELTMTWINEVEMGGCMDDLWTSESIRGKSVLDFEMLDARIASALRKIIPITSFRKRVRFKRTANCLHDLWPLSVNQSL